MPTQEFFVDAEITATDKKLRSQILAGLRDILGIRYGNPNRISHPLKWKFFTKSANRWKLFHKGGTSNIEDYFLTEIPGSDTFYFRIKGHLDAEDTERFFEMMAWLASITPKIICRLGGTS